MKRTLILLLTLGAVAAAAAALAATTGFRGVDEQFRSQALGGTLRFEVLLPRGYDTSSSHYPVVYFLHGLPSGPDGYKNTVFLENALNRISRPAIIVAPQGSRSPNSDPEYLGDWERAIAHELPRVVDARYRTIPERRGRALIGLSAGGYGAMLLALHDLAVFAVVESWSGYFHPTNPAGTAALDLGSPTANAHASAHSYVSSLSTRLKQQPTFIGFYVGVADDRFRDENEQLDRELTAASIPHVFRLYRGGHDSSVWLAHASAWLTLALDHLAKPRG
ncbi:MAG: alpha/beta hydrolase [Gaiellaceae bacterium]